MLSKRPQAQSLLILFAVLSVSSDVLAQPAIEYSGKTEWDQQTGTLTFCSSGSMPTTKEGFFWNIPSEVKRIVIDANVRVTGGLRVLYRKKQNPLFIIGEDRETSVIFGTAEEGWTSKNQVPENDKWKYSCISVTEDAVVHISNLTALNPRGYLVSGYANEAVLHVSSCSLLDTRTGNNNNSDGFAGSAGSSLKDSLISTGDDAIKIYHDITIERVTIEQHRNGAPLQFGWGGESKVVNARIKDLVIKGVDPEHRYNMAPLTWERGQGGVRNLKIDGLDVRTQGKVYDEAASVWKPIGLFELKPTNCELNLDARNVTLHGLPQGMRQTKGSVKLSQGERK